MPQHTRPILFGQLGNEEELICAEHQAARTAADGPPAPGQPPATTLSAAARVRPGPARRAGRARRAAVRRPVGPADQVVEHRVHAARRAAAPQLLLPDDRIPRQQVPQVIFYVAPAAVHASHPATAPDVRPSGPRNAGQDCASHVCPRLGRAGLLDPDSGASCRDQGEVPCLRPRAARTTSRATRPGHGGTRRRAAAVGTYPRKRSRNARSRSAPRVRAGSLDRFAQGWRRHAEVQIRA